MATGKKNQWESHIERWWEHPAQMVRELFGVEPDPWQADVLECFPHTPQIAMAACKGPGKGHSLCAVIPTPTGIRRWGDLQVGDSVFAEDGAPTVVTGRFDLGARGIWRVTFDDGSFARVTDDHLWKVQGRTERRKGLGWAVLSTKEIIARGVTIPNGRWAQKQFIIPRQGAAQFPYAMQPLDPYLVGVWIGDGERGVPSYFKPYPEVREEIERRGYETSGTDRVRILKVTELFDRLDCFDRYSCERFVPNDYKIASVRQRTDLLCGLMDTDGCIGKDGHMEFSTTSERLANDVVWLVRSLGGVALVKAAIKDGWYRDDVGERVECRDCWRVTVVTPFNPFRIPHKAERWSDPLRAPSTARYMTRYIASVEPDGEEEAMCISVAHPSRCYLANDFIVTHNTTTLSWLAWNFLATRPDPNIAATSISGDNLHDGLWKEMSVWRNKAKLLQSMFEVTSERIFRKGAKSTWFMSARTWPKTGNSQAQADTLAGLHSPYVMFILDESGGIPLSVMVAAEAALSSCVEGHILQAGNPTSLDGALYAAAKDRIENGGKTRFFEITADPDDPKRAPRVSVEWARDQIRKYGRDNPWVMVNVFGKFPPGSINTLISEDDVRAAMRRFYRPYEIGLASRVLGIDVARQGLDASVIARREGIQMHNLLCYRNVSDGILGGSIANRVWNEFEADACFVDATGGMGFTWIDGMKTLGKSAIPIQFSGQALQPDRYFNRRSEMAFRFVDWIKMGGALPPEETEGARELLEALSKTQYFHHKDRLQLEDKDQIRARIGFSPDEFDGCILTFADDVTPRRRTAGRSMQHSAVSPYNPFSDMDRQRQGGYAQPGNANGVYDPFAR